MYNVPCTDNNDAAWTVEAHVSRRRRESSKDTIGLTIFKQVWFNRITIGGCIETLILQHNSKRAVSRYPPILSLLQTISKNPNPTTYGSNKILKIKIWYIPFFGCFFFFFFGVRSNFNKLKTPNQWLWTCRQCWVHNKNVQCRTVVLIKTEMDVSGSSWKGRDSLSPELVELLLRPDSISLIGHCCATVSQLVSDLYYFCDSKNLKLTGEK